jgi:acetyltransferase
VRLQKLFVAQAARQRGLGALLMDALHESARERGRSLVLLSARRGDPAERFYRRLGYREIGVVPGYSIGSAGERYDNVDFYRELTV